MSIHNEKLWEDIEQLPMFVEYKDKPEHHYAWHWLENLQKEGHLSSLDIISLKGLLENVYKLGQINSDLH